MYTRLCMCKCECIFMCELVCWCVSMCVCVCVYVFMFAFLCLCVCVYVHVSVYVCVYVCEFVCFRVYFLLKTDSCYPNNTGVNKPWQPLGIPSAITHIGQLHQSPPSPIAGGLGTGPSHQSTCSNIETRMDRPKSVVRVIRGVA